MKEPKRRMRPMTVLVDIDHTVSNAFWRDKMIGGEGGWDHYHQSSLLDEPIEDIVEVLSALQMGGYYLIGITARPEKWRTLTMGWLVEKGVPMDEILMRKDEDYRNSAELKLELAKERFKDIKNEVSFILDDREDVVTAFRAAGITALQVYARRD